MKEIFEYYGELKKVGSMSVTIQHDQVLKIVLTDLISKRNCDQNKVVASFDTVLRYYLAEDEFQRYVINQEPLE